MRAVEIAMVAKLSVPLNLWEPLKLRQTTPAAATIPKRVQPDTELARYLQEDPTDFNSDPLAR